MDPEFTRLTSLTKPVLKLGIVQEVLLLSMYPKSANVDC